jgi:hypothetical protein
METCLPKKKFFCFSYYEKEILTFIFFKETINKYADLGLIKRPIICDECKMEN